MGKKIGTSSLTGQKGVNLIEKIVLDIGWVWNPRGQLEAGIDGSIEIRDDSTGVMSNQVLLVQSKAGKSWFKAETDTQFEYLCDERDLKYWLQGNTPVLLIVSRPENDEAYWVSIKDYFADPKRIKTRKITFNKQTQRFSIDSKSNLQTLAVPKDAGVYHAPVLLTEQLYTNLLSVESYNPKIYTAPTEYRAYKPALQAMITDDEHISREWILKDKMIISFHDLSKPPWNRICDEGAVECFDVEEWSTSDETYRQNEFRDLLMRCLRERCWRDLHYHRYKSIEYLYFKPTKQLAPRAYAYKTITGRNQDRFVFRSYDKKSDEDTILYYRHSAFEPAFKFYDGKWYLEITPTYHYTTDGKTVYRYREDQLSGIKRLEQNPSVLGQVVMWAHYLGKQPPMFDTYPFLKFGDLIALELDVGIDDDDWRNREDDEDDEDIVIFSDNQQRRLF